MRPRYGKETPHELLYGIIDAHRAAYSQRLHDFLSLSEELVAIKHQGEEEDSSRPVWNNGFLPGLDIVALYGLLVKEKPKRYLEVGSGNSTKVAHLAKQNHGLNMKITSIDPYPRAEIDVLADEVIRRPFETVDIEHCLSLGENDILFIDNSHRILPNSDSMVFFMEVLPYLKKGVIVHIHDIYWPYDYPQVMCDRFYSEQYGLAHYLIADPEKYQTILPNFFISEDEELKEILAPLWAHENLSTVEEHGGSYWLRINK
jgi:predicted O-methyltransferase YrrM